MWAGPKSEIAKQPALGLLHRFSTYTCSGKFGVSSSLNFLAKFEIAKQQALELFHHFSTCAIALPILVAFCSYYIHSIKIVLLQYRCHPHLSPIIVFFKGSICTSCCQKQCSPKFRISFQFWKVLKKVCSPFFESREKLSDDKGLLEERAQVWYMNVGDQKWLHQ